jgi:DNA-binding transcriptional regulator YdaS (Cro superfamily)
MSNALEIRVLSAKEASQLLGPTTSLACRLGVSDATLPQPRAIRRVSGTRRREPSRVGRDLVASSIRAPIHVSMAGCGLPGEAKL